MNSATIAKRTFLAIILVVAAVGGTMYHRHWVLHQWTIPTSPEMRQLNRLFWIASYDSEKVASRQPAGQQQDFSSRRRDASRAIVSIGPEAVPFLLTNLKPMSMVSRDDNVRTRAATNILGQLAQTGSLGSHTAAVITKMSSDSDFYRAGEILGAIGKEAVPVVNQALETGNTYAARDAVLAMDPESVAGVLPTLHRACLSTDAPGLLCGALTRAAGVDALPTLRQIIRNEEKRPGSRVAAGVCIAGLGEDGATLVPDVANLLGELTDPDDSAQLIQSLALMGPSAHGATNVLLEILRERGADNQPQAAGGNGEYGNQSSNGQKPLFLEATVALGRIRAKEAVPELIAMLKDDAIDNHAKQVVVEALGDIGPAARSATTLLKEISAIHPTDNHGLGLRTSAFVALARIHIDRAPQLIVSILRRIGGLPKPSTTDDTPIIEVASVEYGQLNYAIDKQRADNQLVADLILSLTWLGAQGDSSIMAASPENSVQPHRIRTLEAKNSPELALLLAAIDASARGDHDAGWTYNGRVLSLCRALQVGLDSGDELARHTAADIWFATMPRVPEDEIKPLEKYLQSPDPQLRMRIAALLITYDQQDASLVNQLSSTILEAHEDVPAHIKAVSDYAQQVESAREGEAP